MIQPISSRAASTNFSVRLQRLSSSPVSTNMGSASSANESTAAYISVTRISGGIWVPENSRKNTQAKPRLNAIGTPITRKIRNGRNRNGADKFHGWASGASRLVGAR